MNYNKFSYFHCEGCNSGQYHFNDKCQNYQSIRHLKTAKACFITAILFALITLSLCSCSIERRIVTEPFICQNMVKSGSLCEYKFVPLNYAYAKYLIEDTGMYAKFDTVSFERVKMGLSFR